MYLPFLFHKGVYEQPFINYIIIEFLYCTHDSAVIKNIQLACKWVEENQHHCAG